jgi:hypothetical protein
MKPLHSKTASKAGSSLWIPLGRGAQLKTAKSKKPEPEIIPVRAFFIYGKNLLGDIEQFDFKVQG